MAIEIGRRQFGLRNFSENWVKQRARHAEKA